MKKKLFSLIIAILVFVPFSVRAATYEAEVFLSEDKEMTKTTLNGQSISCLKSEDGKEVICYLGVKITKGNVSYVGISTHHPNLVMAPVEDGDCDNMWKTNGVSGAIIEDNIMVSAN